MIIVEKNLRKGLRIDDVRVRGLNYTSVPGTRFVGTHIEVLYVILEKSLRIGLTSAKGLNYTSIHHTNFVGSYMYIGVLYVKEEKVLRNENVCVQGLHNTLVPGNLAVGT